MSAMRADVFLVEAGHAATRSQAQRLIAAGVEWRLSPLAPWQKVAKNGDDIPSVAEVKLLDDAEAKYISRGGLKLEGALLDTGLSVAGVRCLDGGLRSGLRVVCVEGVNARSLTAQGLQEACELALSEVVEADEDNETQPEAPYSWMRNGGLVDEAYDDSGDAKDQDIEAFKSERALAPQARAPGPPPVQRGRRAECAGVDTTPAFDLVTGDLSFISLTLVLPAIAAFLRPDGHLLMLVKPQFELQPGQVGKGGVVRDAALYAVVEKRIRDCCAELGLAVQAWLDSPIQVGDGNHEFFVYARRAP